MFDALCDLPVATVVTRSGVIVFVNEAFAGLVGYPSAELSGGWRLTADRDLCLRLSDAPVEGLPGNVQAGLSADPSCKLESGEWSFLVADGTVVPVMLSVEGWGGSTDATIAVVSDLRKQREAERQLTDRLRQQAAIVALGQAALAGMQLPDLFGMAARLMTDVLQGEFGKVLELLPDGRSLLLCAGVGWADGLVGRATLEADHGSQAGFTLLSNGPVVVEDLATEDRFVLPPLLGSHGVVSGMSVVIRGDDGPYGILGVHSTRPVRFGGDDVNCLQAAANVLAEAVQRHRAERALEEARDRESDLRREIGRYSLKVVEAHEAEQRRIAMELHDEVGQALTGLKLSLERIGMCAEGTATDVVSDACSQVTELLQRVHDLSLDLRPSMLDDLGLVPALLWLIPRYERQTAIHVRVEHQGVSRRFRPEIETTAFRVVQEALTNVARHADVKECTVRCCCDHRTLTVSVMDHGVGFEPGEVTRGGLTGMEERVRSLQGRLVVRSHASSGTLVSATLDVGSEGRLC